MGDNLLYKYTAMASFLEWPAICDCAIAAAKKLIGEQVDAINGEAAEAFWDDLHAWLLLTYVSGKSRDEILHSKAARFKFDIARWVSDDCPQDVTPYALPAPVDIWFALSPVNRKNIEAALNVWDYDIKTFSMLVKRMHMSWHVRDMHHESQPATA
jgi:hypothetical protein